MWIAFDVKHVENVYKQAMVSLSILGRKKKKRDFLMGFDWNRIYFEWW